MAQKGVVLDKDQFCCSICLDLLNDPVAIPCGHSYCSSCIGGYWDQNEPKGDYSCPQCRQSFTLRPALKRNNMLAEVVEKLKEKGGAEAAPSELTSPAGPGEVTCDLCTGPRKQRALKSCLMCSLSYCPTHLQPHYQVPKMKNHKLVGATFGLQEMICSRHDKLLEVFCRTDQQCICYLCTMDEHKGHDTASAKSEREEKQDKLVQNLQEFQQRLQQREKELKEVQQALESLKSSGPAAEKESERIFTELIHSIEARRSEVKELIRAQQRAAVSQAGGLVERLEQEIAQLKRTHAELEQLSHTEDNIHFLQNYQSLSNISVSPDVPSISVPPLQTFEHVTDVVSELREKVEELIQRQWSKISTTEPKTRAELLPYSCQLSLDPNTAAINMALFENRKATCSYRRHKYPAHPERFTTYSQVMCREALSGRCYWEVERKENISIAVLYKDISRAGDDSNFRYSDKSWVLICFNDGYSFMHNCVTTAVSGPRSSRVGVYLDHMAGTLSFYSVVSDAVTLLHRVQTTFTQPLYVGFMLGKSTSAEIVKL